MADLLLPEYHADTADDFLNYLSPWRQIGEVAAWPKGWLFRGQERDWPLVPTALRSVPKQLAEITGNQIDSLKARNLAERDALVNFCEIVDQRGLVLPDDSQHLRNRLETLASKRGDFNVGQGMFEWIEDNDLLSLMALAQHYGVPTRLLDWSMRALIAAYFAAAGAAAGSEGPEVTAPDERMVVWAFYFPDLGKQDAIGKRDALVQIVTAPLASNPNLRAQRGVFTLLGWTTRTDDDGNFMPMDKALAQKAKKYDSDSDALIARCKMQKVTLPRGEALRVLKRLDQFDITPSAVYPGYGSIVNDLRLRVRYSGV